MSDARQRAHNHFVYNDGNGCEMVVRALASIGQVREHSERCDQDTAFLEANAPPPDPIATILATPCPNATAPINPCRGKVGWSCGTNSQGYVHCEPRIRAALTPSHGGRPR